MFIQRDYFEAADCYQFDVWERALGQPLIDLLKFIIFYILDMVIWCQKQFLVKLLVAYVLLVVCL